MNKEQIKEYYKFHGEDRRLKACECDNTHEANKTVCRFCYEQKKRRKQ